MADNKFSSWKDDHLLEAAMQMYAKQGLKREEAIDFLRERFSSIPVSLEYPNSRHNCTLGPNNRTIK